MKKTIQKIMCLAMSVVAFVSAQGCIKRDSSREDVRKDATQLYIGLGTNGLDEWMEEEKERFEKKYADYSFEPGKKGVQVFYNFNEKFQNFDTLPVNYKGYQEKLIITERIPYNKLDGMAKDITEIATTPLNKNILTGEVSGSETETIADKMLPQFKEYYERNGRYIAFPSQVARMGLVYDVDLFEDNFLYFASDTATHYYDYSCKNVYTGKSATYRFVDEGFTDKDLSKGPDGKAGTYDDGLPATYEEFFALCDYMQKEMGIEPVRWAGNVQSYMMAVLEGLASDYENDQFLLKSRFNGTADNLVKFGSNGKMIFGADGEPETHSLAINERNGYELTAQKGFYYALKYLEALLGSNYYDKDLCFNGTSSHLTTQTKYLLSSKDSKVSSIAMLAEGSWWYGEAAPTFKDMAAQYGEKWSAQNRRFAYMPWPKYDESHIGEEQCVISELQMTSFVTNDIDDAQYEAAKVFIQEMYTRDGMIRFAKATSQMRPYSLTLTDEELAELTEFGRSNYNTLKYCKLFFVPSTNPVYLANNSLIDATFNFHWTSNIGDLATQVIRSGYSAQEYFEEINKFWTKDRWDSYYKGVAY